MRDAGPPDYSYDDVYVMKIDDEGKRVEVRYPRFVSVFNKFIWHADVIVRTEQEFLD